MGVELLPNVQLTSSIALTDCRASERLKHVSVIVECSLNVCVSANRIFGGSTSKFTFTLCIIFISLFATEAPDESC